MAGPAPVVKINPPKDKKIAIISASWHRDICDALVAGAVKGCEEFGIAYEISYVPGSFELPLAAVQSFDRGFDGAVVLGLVMQGETPHFDYVCEGVTYGVMKGQLDSKKPIGFGVLMCTTMEQAKARIGGPGAKEDKGYDAAIAALSLLS